MAGRALRYEITHVGIPVEVTYKDVKHLRLRVLAPEGRVAATVPLRVDERHVRDFIEIQSGWILTTQQKVRMAQPVVEPIVDGGRTRLWAAGMNSGWWTGQGRPRAWRATPSSSGP
ncbi:M48 family metallopeptidase [Tessaracoccus sp. HDW20]|nr:M48 family metallopeptidase [Tessaracoccus coleopterorum]